MFALRTAQNESTKFTPAELFLGRKIITPLDRIFLVKEREPEFYTKNVKELIEKASKNMAQARTTYAKYYNAQRREYSFRPGQKILRATHPISSAAEKIVGKFCEKFEGPYVITDVKRNNLYIDDEGKTVCINADQARPYYDRADIELFSQSPGFVEPSNSASPGPSEPTQSTSTNQINNSKNFKQNRNTSRQKKPAKQPKTEKPPTNNKNLHNKKPMFKEKIYVPKPSTSKSSSSTTKAQYSASTSRNAKTVNRNKKFAQPTTPAKSCEKYYTRRTKGRQETQLSENTQPINRVGPTKSLPANTSVDKGRTVNYKRKNTTACPVPKIPKIDSKRPAAAVPLTPYRRFAKRTRNQPVDIPQTESIRSRLRPRNTIRIPVPDTLPKKRKHENGFSAKQKQARINRKRSADTHEMFPQRQKIRLHNTTRKERTPQIGRHSHRKPWMEYECAAIHKHLLPGRLSI